MSTPARRLALATSIVLVFGGIAVWPVGRASLDHLVIEAEVTRWEVAPPELAQATQAVRPTPARVARQPLPQVVAAVSGNAHPHPITEEHETLQEELRLVGALQDALDLEDVPALRSLIDRYRAHVPGDENKLAEGYARLADCLEIDHERVDPEVRQAAQVYYENERASTLRRHIMRICLER